MLIGMLNEIKDKNLKSMAESPLIPSSDLITFTIKSNGKDIDDSVPVVSIAINLEKDIADEAIITLLGGLQETVESNGFSAAESNEFSLGKEIKIGLGYGFKSNKVYEGRVTQKKIILNSESGLFLQITCKRTNNKSEAIPKNSKQETPLELTYGLDIMETELYTNSADSHVIYGNLKFQGSAKARVDDTIKLKGFEKCFPNIINNVVCISRVKHRVENGNWTTTVDVGNTDKN